MAWFECGEAAKKPIMPLATNDNVICTATTYNGDHENYTVSNPIYTISQITFYQPVWIQYEFNEPVKATNFQILPRGGYPTQHVSDYELYGSNNGEDWEPLASGSISNPYFPDLMTIEKPTKYKYYTIYTRKSSNSSECMVSVFQLYG